MLLFVNKKRMLDSSARKAKVEDLRFEVYTKPLQAICGTQIMHSNKHIAIHSQDCLLGVKSDKPINSFILNHYEAHQIGEKLYQQLFGRSASKACFLTNDRSWMASMIGRFTDENVVIEDFTLFPDDVFSDLDCQELSVLEDLVENGFTPSIGVVNGFDYNDNLAFYLLVEPTHFSFGSLPVLTLSSFKVEEKHIVDLLKKDSVNWRKVVQKVLEQYAVPKFLSDLKAFNALYNKLSKWRLDQHSLVAISLDLYDKNRNIASINADVQLARELNGFINNAEKYFLGGGSMASVTHFIIRYNEFDFNHPSFFRNKVEQLFVRKKSYQKMSRIFKNFSCSSPAFQKYLKDQITSYELTKDAIYVTNK